MHKSDSCNKYFDAVFISPHKFFGGPGTPGLLIAHKDLFKNKVPYCPAGGTVRFVCPSFQTYSQDIETRETGGTPNILGSIKAGLAFNFKCQNQAFITLRDRQLTRYAQSRLQAMEHVKLLNPVNNLNRLPIFVFTIDKLHYNYIVVLLNDLFGIQSRGGVSCCSLLAQDLLHVGPYQQKCINNQIVSGHGVPSDYGWCRVSFHYSMPDFLVEYILNAIDFVSKYGYFFKQMYSYSPQGNKWMCKKGPKLASSFDQSNERITYLTPELLDQQMASVRSLIQI